MSDDLAPQWGSSALISIDEASERDLRVVVAEDAISGLYDRGREELRNIGVRLMTSEEIVASVGTPAST